MTAISDSSATMNLNAKHRFQLSEISLWFYWRRLLLDEVEIYERVLVDVQTDVSHFTEQGITEHYNRGDKRIH